MNDQRQTLIARIGEFQDRLERLAVERERIKFAEKRDDELPEILESVERQLQTRINFLSRMSEKELKNLSLVSWRERLEPEETHFRAFAQRSEGIIALYADGGVIKKNPSDIGGTWAWCGVGADGNRICESSGVVPATADRKVTNNHTEQIAITLALEAMPDGWSGTVYSDSKIAIGRVFKGYAEENLPRNISERSKAAVKRLGRIETVLLQGHPTKDDLERGIGKKRGLPVSIHNVWCDKACGKASEEYLAKLEEKSYAVQLR